jgi:hypothetical protein
MADGALKLKLDPDLARRLEAASDNAGKPVDAYAAELIQTVLDEDWSEDDARFAEFQRTGVSLPADDVMTRFHKSLTARFAARK